MVSWEDINNEIKAAKQLRSERRKFENRQKGRDRKIDLDPGQSTLDA
jgi:hypothetical protein